MAMRTGPTRTKRHLWRAALRRAPGAGPSRPNWEIEMMERDPKSEFLKHVVVRAGADTTKPGRFKCGHLQRLGKEHLAVGEHFPYGAQGAELLACVVCGPPTERAAAL